MLLAAEGRGGLPAAIALCAAAHLGYHGRGRGTAHHKQSDASAASDAERKDV